MLVMKLQPPTNNNHCAAMIWRADNDIIRPRNVIIHPQNAHLSRTSNLI